MDAKTMDEENSKLNGRGDRSESPAKVSSRRLLADINAGDRKVCREILRLFQQARRILIVGHERPDGDCIGSGLALADILRNQGFSAEVVGEEALPRRFRFLDAGGFYRLLRSGETFDRRDVVVCLDASDRERIGAGLVAAVSRATLVNIDHHNYNTRFGVVNWVDPKASAVGEQIWRFARSLEWTLPPNSLRALYVALITDTGQFSYGNTTPRAMRIAADLVAAGVDPETIWRYVYLEKTTQELALEARARMSLTYWADGRIAVIGVRDRDFAETGTDPQATAEFTNIPRSVVGALMALFFYEIEDGRATKVSIRGVRELNACKLARRFGGGGHPQAAGCTLVKPLAEAMEEFRPAAESAAEALGSAAVLPQKREKHE